MAPKRTRKKPETSARGRVESVPEWVGGRVLPPFFITEGEPYRPELIVWIELPDGLVVGHHLQDRKAPVDFGVTFVEATNRPLVGPPRHPARIRVATPELAESVRRVAGPGLEIVVAPTPELDAVVESMKQAPHEDAPDESYLEDGRVSSETVAAMFRAAEVVYRMAPWKTLDEEALVRVDIPRLGVRGACLSVIGGGGESFGLILFPSLDGFQAFASTAPKRGAGPVDFGTTLLALTFERGADLPGAMRREISEHGWSVAGARAYPVVVHRDRDGVSRPLSDRDVNVIAACASAFCPFFLRNKTAFGDDDGDPISASCSDNDGLVVRFTYPYEAFELFEDDALRSAPKESRRVAAPKAEPRVPRNAPCPCGSGQKYKKCHLPSDEAKDRESQATPAVHEMDERVVTDMQRFAARRFPGTWQAALDVFEDFERQVQLATPWSVYCADVDGRPIVEWYLAERGRTLADDERRWLEAQQRSWLTVWEVTDVDPGRGLRVRDLLTSEERDVSEVKGSQVLVKRDAVLGRVVDHGATSVFCGMHPNPLLPLAAAELVRTVRAKLRRKTALPPERLRDEAIGRFMIGQWEKAVATMQLRANVPPRLTNTDGEKLRLTTDLFTFSPGNRAKVDACLRAIKGVEPPDADDPRYVFLRGGSPGRHDEGRTVLGSVTLAAGDLRLETNSLERADALRARLESACPDILTHARREHADPLVPRLVGKPSQSAGPAAPPGASEAVRAFKRRHYQEWANQPVPALQGKTPREALRTREGRQAVDGLLKDFENHEHRAPPEVRFDFADIRRDLGLPA